LHQQAIRDGPKQANYAPKYERNADPMYFFVERVLVAFAIF